MWVIKRERHRLPVFIHFVSTLVGVGGGLVRLFPRFLRSRSAVVAENLFLRKTAGVLPGT
jgi:hypothetical protein